MNTSKQLTPFKGYDTNNMIFGTPVQSAIIPTNYYIPISTKYSDGTTGSLIFLTPGKLFSFGVSENKSQETGETSGWSFPLCLYSREGPTDDQKEWVDTYNRVVDKIAEHLLEVAPEMGKEFTMAEFQKAKGGLNPLYWKREQVKDEKTGKTILRIVPGSGPTFYPKLIYSKGKKRNTTVSKGAKPGKDSAPITEEPAQGKFISRFYDMNDKQLDPLSLLGKYCHTEAAVMVESIFIGGTKPSIQNKLYEATVEIAESSMTRLVHVPRPPAKSAVLEYKQSGNTKLVNPLAREDDGSIGSDDEIPAPKPVAAKSKPKAAAPVNDEDVGDEEPVVTVRNVKKVIGGKPKPKAAK